MILESISLKNIRSYKNNTIDFKNGISLFEGDVGSGKSTILMAIEFAFFGLGNQKGESLLRKDKLSGTVELVFNIEGKQGIIKRILKRPSLNGRVSQGKGTLLFDGTKLELSPSELKEIVLEIVDFKEDINPRANSHIFRYAVYTPQDQMKEIITQKPDQRMQTLRKAFGIEEYKIAAENANLILKELKDKENYLLGKLERYEHLESEINENERLNDEDKQFLEQLGEKRIKTEKLFEDIKSKIEEYKTLLNNEKGLEADVKHINEYKRKYENDLVREKELLDESEQDLNQFIIPKLKKLKEKVKDTNIDEDSLNDKIEYVEYMIKRKEDINGKIKDFLTYCDAYEKELGENKDNDIEWFEEKREEILNQIKEIETERTDIKEKSETQARNIFLARNETDKISKTEQLLEHAENKCPTCQGKLTKASKTKLQKSLRKNREEFVKKLECAEKEKARCDHEIVKLNQKEVELTKDWRKWEDLVNSRKQLKAYTEGIAECYEKLKEFDLPSEVLGTEADGFDSLNNYLVHLRNKLVECNKLELTKQEIVEIESNETRKKEKIVKINERIKEINRELEKFENKKREAMQELVETDKKLRSLDIIKGEYESIETELNNVKELIIKYETNIQSRIDRTKELTLEIEDLKKAKSKQQFINEYMIWITDYFVPTVKTIEKNILSELFLEFNNTFKEWFNLLIDDETKSARLDYDFTPIVEQEGMTLDTTYLSGGEKTSVALSYRLALNKIVKKVSKGMETNLLILDEPTDGLSNEQLFKFKEILDKMNCSQIIMVSHERELEEIADNITQVKKENGISKIQELV